MSDAEPTAHCMVDLETLGKKPGCVILSIGAQIFDPDAGTLGDTFECKIDWQFSESYYGLVVDPETVAWWNEQSQQARLVLAPGGMDLIAALRLFADFWKRNNVKYFWCHGAGFDEPILAEAFARTDLTAPWEYNGVQCCRTELKRAGVKPDRNAGTHHNALDDARAQALAVIEAGRRRPLITPERAAAAVDLRPALDWYVKATGDQGDDYLNAGGWDDLHEIVGKIGSDLGIEESDDVVPLLFVSPIKEG